MNLRVIYLEKYQSTFQTKKFKSNFKWKGFLNKPKGGTMEAFLEEARRKITNRQQRAQDKVFKMYEAILDNRLSFSEYHNGNGDTGWGWTMQHEGETPGIIYASGVVLNSIVKRSEMVTCYCADCHMLFLQKEEKLTSVSSREYLVNLEPQKLEVVHAVFQAINGILNPPVTIPTLIDNGIESSGDFCDFCNRVNGIAEAIRKDQRKNGRRGCFGTCYDFCTEMQWCRTLWHEKCFCAIPKRLTVLEGEDFESKSFDFWTWYLRVLNLKNIGLYRFELPHLYVNNGLIYCN